MNKPATQHAGEDHEAHIDWVRVDGYVGLVRVLRSGDTLYKDPYVAVATLIEQDGQMTIDAVNVLADNKHHHCVPATVRRVIDEARRRGKQLIGLRVIGGRKRTWTDQHKTD